VKVLKRILKYLKGNLEFILWYSRGEYFTLTSYTDGYWVGNVDDKKSTSGGAFFLGNIIVSCLSKKRPPVSLSTKKGLIYCSRNMFHTSSLYEENIVGYQGRI
jgi:hypothetical protein